MVRNHSSSTEGAELEALSPEQVLQITRALGDPHRYEILKKLKGCGSDAALPCTAVRDCIQLSPPTLSHHMRELEFAGLVRPIREGRNVSYVLRREVLEAYFSQLKSDLA